MIVQRLLLLILPAFFSLSLFANEPDTVFLFSYATTKNGGKNGLHFAWSADGKSWFAIGNEYGFVKSDYGRWGSEKRMLTPHLIQANGWWHCVWGLNERERLFAHAASKDLVNWGRQSYPFVTAGVNCLQPVIQYNGTNHQYTIVYTDSAATAYQLATSDFKKYSAPVRTTQPVNNGYTSISLSGAKVWGQQHRVAKAIVDNLIAAYDAKQHRQSLYNETTKEDGQRFAGLKPVEAKITVTGESPKRISNVLMGVFFEDINYAADGGLYAELIQNRDFEYSPADKGGRDNNWNSRYAWSLKGASTTFIIDSAAPVHPNNPHYAVLETSAAGAALKNTGFDGIAVQKGQVYNVSLFAKNLSNKTGQLTVQLISEKAGVLAETTIKATAARWQKISATLTSSATAADVQLSVKPLQAGKVALDLVSLFPQQTFKGRKNGLRTDLAQAVADIRPRFVRFPGGCVAHGDGIENIYDWKGSIGPLEARKPQRNIWNYHQTAGLGYLEYFQFCEDIGAEPLPVVAAGVPCQNSGSSARGGGQQGGIPMSEMDQYVQDVLDLIEWANGDSTTTWGKLRAAAGHPKPFNLKYIGIGNEDMITDVFEERFTMIYKAVKKKHPEITVIGTVGPFYEGTDYNEGWQLASKLAVPMVDEHYYVSPGWMIHNQHFYDGYDRSKAKVYLGEYAAHLPGRPNNLETALAEALYLTSVERNGDVVQMASYAPLLAKEGHTQWNPDLIYFNNTEVKPTVGYHVQKLFGQNSGTTYLPAAVTLSNNNEAVKKRIAFSVVRDETSGDVIVKLVNLLPVDVSAGIELGELVPTMSRAIKTVLTGQHTADKSAVPEEKIIQVGQSFAEQLPPYSFTVIRIQTKK